MGNNYRRVIRDGEGAQEHVVVAEKALGKRLPKGAVVHHANQIKNDNRNDNLVVCPDGAYHRLLHKRMKAIKACGHADWLICSICKKYDDPKNLQALGPGPLLLSHPACFEEANKPKPKKDRELTDLQSQVLSFIGRFHIANGYPPTRGEISKEFGWIHPSAAQKHINLIAKKGYIKVMPKISRGIVVIKYD